MSDSTITDLIKAIDPTINIRAIEKKVAPSPQFYAHINRRRLQITAITKQKLENDPTADVFSKEIDFALAEKFLTGAENPTRWAVVFDGENYNIISASQLAKNKTDRISVMAIYEVTDNSNSFKDISIEVDLKNSMIKIHYNKDMVFHWGHSAKLYFTREGDPSHLKCAFTLDADVLNKITKTNQLKEWPNPICFRLSDIYDLSIYAVKSDIRIAKYETVNYGI